MKRIITPCRLIVCLLYFFTLNGTTFAQSPGTPCDNRATYLYWVGQPGADFFDENNWREGKSNFSPLVPGKPECNPSDKPIFLVCKGIQNTTQDKIPVQGTIDPGVPIPYNLVVDSSNVTIESPLVFSCIDKGLNLNASQLKLKAPVSGTIHINESSTLRMDLAGFPSYMRINIADQGSWVYFNKMRPDVVANLPLSSWMVKNKVPENLSSILINQYYQTGALVRANQVGYSPLTVYEASSLQGGAATVSHDTIYSGSMIPGGMEKKFRSFKLKRGYMATFAVNKNGTGKSQVYIASEKDLEVNDLPAALKGNVSFIRVVPWNWVTKKGTGGFNANNQLDAGWFYNWGATQNSQINYEYVPMSWGAGATAPPGIQNFVQKKSITHVLGFNESDNCAGESGQYNSLCEPEVAVAYYERLMQTGLRLGSPAPRENGHFSWLRNFARIAKERDVRFDFVTVHWYDWSSSPANSPYANPQQVFNRFKAYLQRVYDEYKLPIWITEFNANPNRDNSVNAAFLQLALPFLDTLSYVERYAYFEPNPQFGSNTVATSYYLDASGNLTNIGQIYNGQVSNPSMPDSVYECANNLNGLDLPLTVKQTQEFVFEAECGLYPGKLWTTGEDATASNGKFIKGSTSTEKLNELASLVHFDFEVSEESNFRIWIRSRNNGAMAIHIDHERVDSINAINNVQFTWQSIPRLYSFKPGKHRVSLGFLNAITEFDQIAFIAGSEDVQEPTKQAGFCDPGSFTWGNSDSLQADFEEGEAAVAGSLWTIQDDEKAIDGKFIGTEANNSVEVVPGANGRIEFSVEAVASGAYQFWAKVQSTVATSNQLWIQNGVGEFQKWTGLYQPDFVWKWVRFDPSTESGARQEYLFLDSGTHKFTIAYASGGVKIDRVALMPFGQSPSNIDPDVFLEAGIQSFEAEQAEFIGSMIVQNCVNASNGQMVNIGRIGTAGIRFNNVLADRPGPYNLTIHYMSAVQRNLRVLVNGVETGIQPFAISGPWCFNGGFTATKTISIQLNAGVNTIDLRPIGGTDAPIIDKIDLQRPVVSLEAEDAVQTGTVAIQNCVKASGSELVKLGFLVDNAIQFNSINIPADGEYDLNVFFISKEASILRMSIDGGSFVTQNFVSSGEWCFNGGGPAVKSSGIYLTKGIHTIRFQPLTGEAPLLDKIEIVEKMNAAENLISSSEQVSVIDNSQRVIETLSTGKTLYPNPAKSGGVIYIPQIQNATVSLMSIHGAKIRQSVLSNTNIYSLPQLKPGSYLLRVDEKNKTITYRLIVQ